MLGKKWVFETYDFYQADNRDVDISHQACSFEEKQNLNTDKSRFWSQSLEKSLYPYFDLKIEKIVFFYYSHPLEVI